MQLRGARREEQGVLAVLTDRLGACWELMTTALGTDETRERGRLGAAMHPTEVLAYARAELRAATTVPSG